jgi:ATP-dependent Clp protease ATP-binding subunit ClpA
MRTLRSVTFCLLVMCFLTLVGCGKKADENKPITEVKAEAEKMSAEKLHSMALTYKDAIVAKRGDIEKVASQLKDIPVAKMLGDESKKLKAEIDALNTSVSALKERFQVYFDKLKEKGGNLSGLEL